MPKVDQSTFEGQAEPVLTQLWQVRTVKGILIIPRVTQFLALAALRLISLTRTIVAFNWRGYGRSAEA